MINRTCGFSILRSLRYVLNIALCVSVSRFFFWSQYSISCPTYKRADSRVLLKRLTCNALFICALKFPWCDVNAYLQLLSNVAFQCTDWGGIFSGFSSCHTPSPQFHWNPELFDHALCFRNKYILFLFD